MSKVSAMQAMREARYSARPTPKPTVPPSAPRLAAVPVIATIPPVVLDEALVPTGRPVVMALAELPATGQPAAVRGDEPELALLPAPDVDASETEELCGHRSMNNRKCRRPAGHSEKNHRYN